jgi:hypothetical protein
MKRNSNLMLVTMTVAMAFFCAQNLEAQDFSIPWYTIDGGGGFSSGGVFELNGTIGQHDAGPVMTGDNFTLTGGFWVGDADAILLGDVNLDGFVNLLDVAPFIDRITTGKYQAEADTNQDGFVNLLDVQPFVALLTG